MQKLYIDLNNEQGVNTFDKYIHTLLIIQIDKQLCEYIWFFIYSHLVHY